jgi:error-prone DNA polymerase
MALVGASALDARRHGVGGLVDRLVGLFGRRHVWIELQRHFRRDEQATLQSLVDLSAAFRVPVIASNGVRFATPDARPLYDVFTCLRHKTTLERAGRRLTANAERYLKPPEHMAAVRISQARGTEALAEQLIHARRSRLQISRLSSAGGRDAGVALRRITQVGARSYRPYRDRARRIQRELDLIEKLDLAVTFIVWDLVNFAGSSGFSSRARRPTAPCCALGITAVGRSDGAAFERLSRRSGEWPTSISITPSGVKRERVIQCIYERYGRWAPR